MIKGELFDINNNESLGIIGNFAWEYNGEKFYIGDIVKVREFGNGLRIIVRRNNKGDCFISGYRNDSNSGWARNRIAIKKIKSYTELENGKRYDYAVAKVKHINENKRIS